ncbi:MAG: hypothetical protein Q8J74_11315 [Candidatus Didemnitutus sp.]|nr:hypothetical protein [Candidatus Didemnitutus sp.]
MLAVREERGVGHAEQASLFCLAHRGNGQLGKILRCLGTFETQSRRLGVETAWDPSEHWRLRAGAFRLWGQVVTNATGAGWALARAGAFGPAIQDCYIRTPWEVSNTFGPGWVA